MAVSPAPARTSRRWRGAFSLLSVLALVGMAVPVLANHVQTVTTGGNTFTVEFDHDGDNAWWVEFQARASNGDSIVLGETLVEGTTTWRGMNFAANDYERQQAGWSKFAPEQSFNVPTGKRVMFRVHLIDGVTGDPGIVQSCWFTHPAGAEQCGGTTTTTSSSTTGSTFNAPFTGVRGNEWWIQANVGTNGPPIAKVDATLDRGQTWKPLAKQSWGATAWAASFHIPQGTVVQLRATATTGATDLSSCRQWIPPSGQDAAIVPCGSTSTTTSPHPTPFDATFTGVKGNDWWVQVNVAGNQPIAGVGVRVNCDTEWRPLAKQSWGGWAASFHIPPGSKVDFQARTAMFASDASGGYIWPQASPASGCPQGNWPREDSYVTYRLDSGVCGSGECEHSSARLHLVYDQGRWLGRCLAQDRHTASDGTVTTRNWQSEHVGLPPSHESPYTAIGRQHRPDMFFAGYGQTSCSMGWVTSPVHVHSVETVTVDLESRDDVTLDAWSAASRDEVDNLYTTHWDKDTGLVLDIHSNPRRSAQGSASMVLIDTNIPLR